MYLIPNALHLAWPLFFFIFNIFKDLSFLGLVNIGFSVVEASLITKQSNYDFKGQNNSDELRIYGMGAQILSEIGVKKMILLTNTEWKFIGLDAYNIEIIQTKFLSTIDE